MDTAMTTAGPIPQPLRADQLYRPTDISRFAFTTTSELQPIDGLVGQARALEAIRFGTHVANPGFNLFVIGPNGARMQDAVKALLADEARGKPSPSDWVYVNNFAAADRPVAIELPAGRARKFHDAMHKLIDDLTSALPAVFQSEDYQTRRGAIDESFQKKQGEAFSALRDKAAAKDIVILRTPLGFALAPAKTARSCRPMNSTPGLRPSATRFSPSSKHWKRTSSISFTRFRNGRSNGAMKCASSIAIRQNTRSIS